ncbi:MAG TPA: methylmalonyl-CoA epimerase [Propionibacteriaceae bacterium]|nr:methylmalonyl-CoA epimerase [Propionibacteriaceae bacterium]
MNSPAAADILAPLVEAVDHVGLAVPDLDEAIAFHTATFGLTLLHREENAEQGVAEAMLGPRGGDTGLTQIQLIAPLTPDSVIARFLERSGPGLQQLAYRVSDVDRAAAALRQRGLRVLYDSARRGTRGARVNFVHPKDAGGVLIELIEPADG